MMVNCGGVFMGMCSLTCVLWPRSLHCTSVCDGVVIAFVLELPPSVLPQYQRVAFLQREFELKCFQIHLMFDIVPPSSFVLLDRATVGGGFV